MKNLILSFFLSLFGIMAIWFFISVINYGDDYVNYRLDLESNISMLTEPLTSNYEDLYENIQNFIAYENTPADDMFAVVGNFFENMYYDIIEFFSVITAVINVPFVLLESIFGFIFFPKFIPIY